MPIRNEQIKGLLLFLIGIINTKTLIAFTLQTSFLKSGVKLKRKKKKLIERVLYK
jgi:hypothetical protein